MNEIRSLTPSYAGASYSRLAAGQGLQWPCPDEDHPGTPYLHRGRFSRGRGAFLPCEFKPVNEAPDEEFEFLLTTGRLSVHFHTGSMTRRTALLDREAPAPSLEIHPEDAKRLTVHTGDLIEVASRRGSVRLKAEVTDRVPRKVVFSTFHFQEAPINLLTNPVFDPTAKIPEFKGCAVKIRRCP